MTPADALAAGEIILTASVMHCLRLISQHAKSDILKVQPFAFILLCVRNY